MGRLLARRPRVPDTEVDFEVVNLYSVLAAPRESVELKMYCGSCGGRKFDVSLPRRESALEEQVELVVRCRCHYDNCSPITLRPGQPASGGVDGPWRCARCLKYLATIDADRGQFMITCRRNDCKNHLVVTMVAARDAALAYIAESREQRGRVGGQE